MAIIVEDGTRPPGANSYVSLADARSYAAARGITLSAVDADLEKVVMKAMDFIESHDAIFVGERVERDQPVAWPRVAALIDGWSWSSSEIPRQLITATLEAILEVHAGVDPNNPPDALPIVRTRVEGAVEVEYAQPSSPRTTKRRPAVLLLRRLLRTHDGAATVGAFCGTGML